MMKMPQNRDSYSYPIGNVFRIFLPARWDAPGLSEGGLSHQSAGVAPSNEPEADTDNPTTDMMRRAAVA